MHLILASSIYAIQGWLDFHPSTSSGSSKSAALHCAYIQKLGAPVSCTLLDDFVLVHLLANEKFRYNQSPKHIKIKYNYIQSNKIHLFLILINQCRHHEWNFILKNGYPRENWYDNDKCDKSIFKDLLFLPNNVLSAALKTSPSNPN